MVLIFSDEFDHSTVKVMEYLHRFGGNSIRLNIQDILVSNLKVSIDSTYVEILLKTKDQVINLSSVDSVWFRRGGIYMQGVPKTHILKNKNQINDELRNHLLSEQRSLSKLIYESIMNSHIRVLGNPLVSNTDKLSVLHLASSVGLKTPKTLITTSKSDLTEFVAAHGSVVTKAIQDNIKIQAGNSLYGVYTEIITQSLVESLPERFIPSLFQEEVVKKFDIRVFYLDNNFYSIAIYSQEDRLTSTDFRKYNFEHPNRKSKIDLPIDIKNKLKLVLDRLRLNTASIDLILDTKDNFIFLEINPVGQYDMVGKLMNFHLDKKIAEWLMQKN